MGTCGSSGLRQPHSSDGSGAVRQRRTPISCPERQQRHLILLGVVSTVIRYGTAPPAPRVPRLTRPLLTCRGEFSDLELTTAGRRGGSIHEQPEQFHRRLRSDGHRLPAARPERGPRPGRLDLDNWEFRPASAGHRLIEHGYTIRPDRRSARTGTVAGWRAIPAKDRAWSTIAVPTGRPGTAGR